MQCEVRRKCSLFVALRRGRAQVMFLDNNTATASHKARMHGPGWRTAHASSIDEKSLMVSYGITLRQLPPRLMRALLVYIYTYIWLHNICLYMVIMVIVLKWLYMYTIVAILVIMV